MRKNGQRAHLQCAIRRVLSSSSGHLEPCGKLLKSDPCFRDGKSLWSHRIPATAMLRVGFSAALMLSAAGAFSPPPLLHSNPVRQSRSSLRAAADPHIGREEVTCDLCLEWDSLQGGRAALIRRNLKTISNCGCGSTIINK